ncbi:sulfatase-like hydrolase/transferase [Halobaculum roseum]|uniref:Sulfatase-like hydrolase/transferase n=1 Tax=Halobaculum roseum TaxID=2175149 RepID=A0ABD5MQK2_9EURY|nr:sulfatase-like hydrolase/transferase [Halobaculum roseum]QZY03251.1 sulfatase-like hydrolase/transferase [Halobaculum roseum]
MNSVVFLSVDCLRADHLGCYNYERPTSPNIDDFANSATIYKHGYANCPGTRWAFQSLHTGVYTHQIDGLGIPDRYTPLAALFSNAEYATGGFAVNAFVSREYNYNRGFDTFYSVSEATGTKPIIKRIGKKISDKVDNERLDECVLKPVNNILRNQSTGDSNEYKPSHTDKDSVDQALHFIEQQQTADNEFFCWVHFMDAHTPYGYWPKHLEAIRGNSSIEHTIQPGEEGKIAVGENPPKDVIDTYDACIRSVDEQIGRVLSAIDENTTVILTGDHGEEFGQYNDFHSASLYSSMTQVPIIVRTPSIPTGIVETPVQHLDLPPTMLTAAGISVPDHFEGVSLQTINRTSTDPIFFSLGKNQIAVRKGIYKYIEENGSTELYRVPHSGQETDSVLNENKEIAEKLQKLIEDHRQRQSIGEGKLELSKGQDDLSDEIEKNLEDLGYL